MAQKFVIEWLTFSLTFIRLVSANEKVDVICDNILLSKPTIACCLLFLLSFSLFNIGEYDISGTDKQQPTVFIDEYHSTGWESVYEPLDKQNYGGQKSTYTYTTFLKTIEQVYDVKVINSPEDYVSLTANDILIIKTPTISYEAEEIASIQTFVNNGGGLWLIGDHTNLMSMGETLNSISSDFGINYKYDSVYDLQSGNLTTFDRSKMPIFPSALVSTIDYFKFATSCSITSDIFTEKVIIGNKVAMEKLDMSHPNFFGDLSLSESEYFGLAEQCVAKEVGKGRVVAYSDSTTFSSYSVLMKTNPELIFSTLNYLKQTNSLSIFTVIAVFLLGCGVVLLVYKRKNVAFKSLVVIFVLAIPFGIFLSNCTKSSFSNKMSDAVNTDLLKIETVYFYNKDKEVLEHFVGQAYKTGEYNSLFIAFQRYGLFPRELYDLNRLVNDNAKAIVILDPSIITHDDLHILDKYVAQGGKLLICTNSVIDEKLEIFSFFKINYAPQNMFALISDESVTTESDSPYGLLTRSLIPYGQAFADTYVSPQYANLSVDYFSYNHVGAVYVLHNSELFDNIGLGDPGMPPTRAQANMHDEFYAILDFVF